MVCNWVASIKIFWATSKWPENLQGTGGGDHHGHHTRGWCYL